MYIPLILFFTSLASIILMVGRRLSSVPKEALTSEQFPIELPYLKEVREKSARKIKKHGYETLVATIRMYIRGTNFLKLQYEMIKTKIKSRRATSGINGEKKEISKFLRVIGEYKQKIREIKQRISKEESL